MSFDQIIAELQKAHGLFHSSQSPLDRAYLVYVWKKLDNHLLSLTEEPLDDEASEEFA